MNQYMDYGIKTRQWADGTIYNNRMMFRHLILYPQFRKLPRVFA
ncbi:MAG: hypothetical protein SPJ65_12940 [Roseburia sp.]|nr:hypothetical protein [Roseburia sp.]